MDKYKGKNNLSTIFEYSVDIKETVNTPFVSNEPSMEMS